jgi:hypothetical protein
MPESQVRRETFPVQLILHGRSPTGYTGILGRVLQSATTEWLQDLGV